MSVLTPRRDGHPDKKPESLVEIQGFFIWMEFTVYILYSHRIKKFYTGFTGDMEQRMLFHNTGMNAFTKKGVPWLIIATIACKDKTSALLLEKQIKKNGAKRYLERNNIPFSL